MFQCGTGVPLGTQSAASPARPVLVPTTSLRTSSFFQVSTRPSGPMLFAIGAGWPFFFVPPRGFGAALTLVFALKLESAPVPIRGDEGDGHGAKSFTDAADCMALCCTAQLTPCVGCRLKLLQ